MESKSYLWKGKTILIVEDLPHNFELLEAMLLHSGVSIVWARNGLEAVEFVADTSRYFDVIIMDISLPIVNGYQAMKKIREVKPYIPIVTLTAYAYEGEREKSFEAGTNDYLTKPINSLTLMPVLAKYLSD